MKKNILYLISIVSILFLYCYFYTIYDEAQHETDGSFKIIANLDTTLISNETLITPVNKLKQENIRQLFTRFNVSELQAVYRNRFDGKGHLKPEIISSSIGTWQQIILKDDIKARDLVTLLKKEKGVLNIYIERPMLIKPCIAPNDPFYSSQWHLRSISYPMADINAEQAWDINRGRSDVIIAVCDGGVDYTHSDLDPGNRSRVIAGYDSGSDDNDPMDDLLSDNNLSFGGHGTHVAGIIGAIAHNGNQVSGVMWNCRIMPVKMVGSGGFTFSYPFGSVNWDFSTTAFPSDVADAIDYAVNNGAHVINLSYGFSSMGALLNEVITRVPLLYNSILNAYNHNVVVVAAMGNEYNNGNKTQYPAAFPEVIAVGNTTNNNPPMRWGSSSTGPYICVSAPGTDIWSTTVGGGIGKKTGTSMAAPVVSGVAGLIISQGLDRNFNLTNDDVRHIIEQTAVDIGTAGFDYETGYGLINAQSALQLLNVPNVLTHYNSIGGTSVMVQNLSKWILSNNTSGLAAGVYLNVDQYKITKHINFDIPYCSAPKIWMRDRESKCLSVGNPNGGRPFSIIKNITNTGFDLEYYIYYVRYYESGQQINKWVPSEQASTNVAYTVVGQPNLAAIASISGPSIVCSSGNNYTINNPPPVSTIVWECGPGLTITSGQNTTSCTFAATSYVSSWVTARLVTDCGSTTLPQKTVWAGGPQTPVISGPGGLHCGDQYSFSVPVQSSDAGTTYSWDSQGLEIEDGNLPTCKVSGYFNGNKTLSCTVTACGVAKTATKTVNVNSCGLLLFSPNPSNDQTIVSIESGVPDNDLITNGWDMEVYDPGQMLKLKKVKLINRITTLNTSDWKEGVYVVRAKIGDEMISEKLVVKH